MQQKGNTASLGVRDLLKILFISILVVTGIPTLEFWVSPTLGVFVGLLSGFIFTFSVAPAIAGRLIAALILARRNRRMGGER